MKNRTTRIILDIIIIIIGVIFLIFGIRDFIGQVNSLKQSDLEKFKKEYLL